MTERSLTELEICGEECACCSVAHRVLVTSGEMLTVASLRLLLLAAMLAGVSATTAFAANATEHPLSQSAVEVARPFGSPITNSMIFKDLQDIIAILRMDELSPEDKLTKIQQT